MPIYFALPVAFAIGLLAERMGWLRPKAAWAAALVGGLPLWAGGVPAALVVIFFVVVGSVASRLNQKSRDKSGRTAWQILANGLPAAAGIALGSPAFFLGALATACADTLASEVGARSRFAWHPRLGKVESGTNAAISVGGTIALFAGAWLFVPWAWWLEVPALPIALAGIAGAFADTLWGLLEDKFSWWSNDLTNFLATISGGMVALVLSSLV